MTVKIDETILKEFLKESNHIEREYDLFAHDDAYKAWKFIETFDELNETRILEIHRILMDNLNPRIAGRFRNCDVRVGYKSCPSFMKVSTLLERWLKYQSKPDNEKDIKKSHVSFERIHPFEDGNGRVGRILYNWQRTKAGLPIHVIHEGEEQHEYYKWFD